jgi:hypothetical protein
MTSSRPTGKVRADGIPPGALPVSRIFISHSSTECSFVSKRRDGVCVTHRELGSRPACGLLATDQSHPSPYDWLRDENEPH